jgi:hypothetical protein
MSSGVSTRLVQLTHPDEGRRAALVYGNQLHLLATYRSVYSFAMAALDTGWKLRDLLSTDLSGIELDYNQVHALATPWRFLPSFDHPEEPGRCLVSAAGPPWRYLGSGASLRGHGDPVPEACHGELAAVYVIGREGPPRRVGVTLGQVSLGFSTRSSVLGPELTLDAELARVDSTVKVIRAGREVWSQSDSGGDAPLGWVLASVEPDHFEAAGSSRFGDAHVHFFGERIFGAREPIPAYQGDELAIEFPGLGRTLHNTYRSEQSAARRVAATPL